MEASNSSFRLISALSGLSVLGFRWRMSVYALGIGLRLLSEARLRRENHR